MNINKNISIWRGDSTPPTNYHFWIKSNGQQFTFNGEKWVNYVEDIPTASLESKGLMSSQDKVNLEECVQHLEDTSNPHHVSKEQIGLGNVTNDAQVKRSELGVTVATLNDNGKVAESQLPSYVDDILEGKLVSVTEFTLNAGQHGEVKQSGVIYLDTTTNTSYRWSGSQYVMTGSSLTLGEGEDQAFPGNRGVNLENQSVVTSLLSEASEDKVTIKVTQKSLDGKSESTNNVDVRAATATKAGVMSATDKAALDELPDLISEAEISSISNTQTANDVTIETHSANQRLTTTIPCATSTTAGVMSAEDKVEVNKIKDKADKVELKAVSDKVDTIIVPTKVSELTNDLAFQTKTEVNTAIQKVVGAAPEALDTLEEIAAKLSDNDDAVAGIVNTLSDKANIGDSYTKTESDAKYLTTGAASDTYLPKATYTASDILTKIKTVDGTGSELDADLLDGVHKDAFNGAARYVTDNTRKGGYYKIKIKDGREWMLSFKIIAYQSYALQEIVVTGYHYEKWFQPSVALVNAQGEPTPKTVDVTFGYDDDGLVWVAIPAKNYAGILVTDVANGFQPVSDLHNLFEIVYEATLSGTVKTIRTASRHATMIDNVASATKLQTASKINGTAFDGTADITTAKWGTARNLTIGNTAKSVDGSSAMAWSLAEIGALGVNANAVSASKLQTARTIWGQSFDGTDNVAGTLSGVEEILFNVNARLNASNSAFRFVTKGDSAQGIQAGNLLISHSFADANKVPENGIYSKGNIITDGNVTATSFVKTGGTASQFLKADGSVDSNSYLLSSAYTASDILTKLKTVDGAGSGLDADTLDGVHGKGYMYYNAYNFSNGCLVRLKLLTNNNGMVTVHIHGNSYSKGLLPINTWVQFYYFETTGALIDEAALHNGYDFGKINVFCYDGHIYMWFKQTGDYQSFSVYAECTNNPHIGNLVENITNAAMPTEGVTRLKTIVPKKSALTTDLSNVLKEDVVDGPILEEIENLTKEELKAELLGDVDSKLVTKVDKVEGKGLSTNDYTNAEKSKLSTLPTATELDDLITYTQEIIGDSEDIIARWDDEFNYRLLYIKSNAKRKVFDDLWISAAGSNGTVDHTHTEDGVNKPYYLNEVWMTYEEALVVYNESYADIKSLYGRLVRGVTNFAPPHNNASVTFSNFNGPNAVTINVGAGFLVSGFMGWMSDAPKLTKIIGNINLTYWQTSVQSYGYLRAPALTDVSLYHLHNNFNISFLKSISLSSMQYMVNNSTATSPITVTVHPRVYAKLTRDTTNINPSTKITRAVTRDDVTTTSDEQVILYCYYENLIFEPLDTIIIPDIINPGTNEPIRGIVDVIDRDGTPYQAIRVILEKPAFDEAGEVMFNTVPIGSKIMRVDKETSEEELAQWQALVTTANSKNISFATPK